MFYDLLLEQDRSCSDRKWRGVTVPLHLLFVVQRLSAKILGIGFINSSERVGVSQ